jgi:hypothetical protein
VGKLRGDGLRTYQDAVLHEASASRHGDYVIATHIASLHDIGRGTATAALLTRAMEGRDRRRAMQLVDAIRELRHQGALDAMAGWVRATAAGESDARYTLLRLGLREYAKRR